MQDFDQPTDNARIITTRPDILALLRGMSSTRSNALISFFSSSAQLSGKITQINPYFDEIVFMEDVGTEANFPPGKASLITVLSSIKLQFHAERVEPTEFEGKPAWRVRIPKMLFCSERRESVRIAPPVDEPLEIVFSHSPGREPQLIRFPVVDIGDGGVGVLINPMKIQVELGKVLSNCVLNLPGVGEVVFDLIIRNTTEIAGDGSSRSRRCGCQYNKISLDAIELIRRYIELNDVEAQ